MDDHTTTHPQTELRLLTLNAWGFRWPLARHRAARFDRIGAHLSSAGYDIVALQELWRGGYPRLAQSAMSWAPAPEPVDDRPRHRRTRRVDSGLGVKLAPALADGPVTSQGHAFADHRGWDRVKRKGALRVDVPIAGGEIVTVVTTHLQAAPRHARVRRRQLDEIGALLDGIVHPIILLGDFNLHRGSDEDRAGHAQLGRWGFRDAGEALDRPHPTYLRDNPYVPWREGDQRFDRIYLRDGARARLTPRDHEVLTDHSAPLSDHEAVSSTVVVTRI